MTSEAKGNTSLWRVTSLAFSQLSFHALEVIRDLSIVVVLVAFAIVWTELILGEVANAPWLVVATNTTLLSIGNAVVAVYTIRLVCGHGPPYDVFRIADGHALPSGRYRSIDGRKS